MYSLNRPCCPWLNTNGISTPSCPFSVDAPHPADRSSTDQVGGSPPIGAAPLVHWASEGDRATCGWGGGLVERLPAPCRLARGRCGTPGALSGGGAGLPWGPPRTLPRGRSEDGAQEYWPLPCTPVSGPSWHPEEYSLGDKYVKETDPMWDRAGRYGVRRGAKGSTNPYFGPLFCQGAA